MKRKIFFILAAVFLVAGLVFLLFEPVATEVEKKHAESVAEEFDEVVEQVMNTPEKPEKKKNSSKAGENVSESSGERVLPSREQLMRLYEDSKAYNKRLINNQGTVRTTSFYYAALNLSNYGIYDNMYCYISAPTIGMKLPVYLGAGDYQLNSGAAHLCNTSLPVNMNNTHVAIAGHTGYFGRIFFDNIRALSIGDPVTVRNYWQTVSYRVIRKKVVAPNNTSDLVIEKGKALMTLITCISNGKGGFDRCLVTCEKV